jgi:RNA-splicing ligase RtcB
MITGDDLKALGWTEGPRIGAALSQIRRLEAEGKTQEEILKLYAAPPHEIPKLTMRTGGRLDQLAPLALAIKAEGETEAANLKACEETMYQVRQLPVVVRTALMPDACPAGPGVCVGGVVETRDAIIPAMHSADLCCSMCVSFFIPPVGRSVTEMMDTLQSITHFGIGGRTIPFCYTDFPFFEFTTKQFMKNPFLQGLQERALRDLGTCGDGNHFNMLGRFRVTHESLEVLWKTDHHYLANLLRPFLNREVAALVTHFGSRSFGAEVFKRGKAAAEKETAKIATGIPSWGHWIPGSVSEIYENYWEALVVVEWWTQSNHRAIHDLFLMALNGQFGKAGERFKNAPKPIERIFNAHNFVWRWPDYSTSGGHEMVFHGKGATPAWNDTSTSTACLGVIPLNMAEPVLLVVGEANKEFLFMAPHGAGRNLSRTELMKQAVSGLDQTLDPEGNKQFVVDELIKDQTKGLDVRWFSGKPDLSETPMAYKNAAAVKRQIKEFALATVWGEIEPLGCVMAGEQLPKPWEKKS